MRSRGQLAVALLLVCGIVAWTCAPVLADPQLEPDDYRYLALVTDLKLGRVSFLQAAVVENRWDHLWWVDTAAAVRFFRPTLILSFLVDDAVHGASPAGLLVTNVLLHLGCCVLVTLLALRCTGGLGAVLASALFAAFACHAETIWYVSGRNETLAAFGFLLALLLHAWGRRWLALPCFAVALCAKELTAALPVVLWLYDRLAARRREPLRVGAPLWVAYAGIGAGYFAARHMALGAGGVDLVYPYLVAPTRPDFLAHVWGQMRNYGENLLLARTTPPFLRPDQVARYTSETGLAASALVLVVTVVALWRERRFWILAACALLTWLPTSFVYVSERYLYLPSFAAAVAAGLVLERSRGWRPLRIGQLGVPTVAVAGALVVWTFDQAGALLTKNRNLMGVPREAEAIARSLAEFRAATERTHRLLLVNLPTGLLGAQFVESQMRWVLRDPDLVCRVLTVMPMRGPHPRSIGFARQGRALQFHGTPVLMAQDAMLFPWRRLEKGTAAESPRLGFRAEVADGDGASCSTVGFTLEPPPEAWTIVAFVPPDGIEVPVQSILRGEYVLAGRMQIVQP